MGGSLHVFGVVSGSLCLFWSSLCTFWGSFGRSWAYFGVVWGSVCLFRICCSRFGAVLGSACLFWGCFGVSVLGFPAFLLGILFGGCFRVLCVRFGGQFGGCLCPFGVGFGFCVFVFSSLCPFWVDLGAPCAHFGVVLGLSAHLGVPLPPLLPMDHPVSPRAPNLPFLAPE